MRMTVTPLWRRFSIRRSMCLLAEVSSPAHGSSSTSTDGSQAMIPAMATSLCWPPDSSNGFLPRRSDTPTRSKAQSTRSRTCAASKPWLVGPNATSSATVSANSWRSGCCITNPSTRRKRLRSRRLACVTSMPSTTIRPPRGLSSAHSRRAKVVFPDPFGPMMAVRHPRGIRRFIWLSTSADSRS